MAGTDEFEMVDLMFGGWLGHTRRMLGIDVEANAHALQSEGEAEEEAIADWPEHYGDAGHEGMSNFDHVIPPDLEEVLHNSPVVSWHSAWNFNARIWWQDDAFHEQVWRYHVPAKQYKAATLAILMKTVNDEFGWE